MTKLDIAIVVLLPFIGTALGAASALFLGQKTASKMQNTLLGFASGVMVAAAVWSLLIPSISASESAGNMAWLPAAIGFLVGVIFMLLLDAFTPHLHINSSEPEGLPLSIRKSTMLMLAVTLHNIPEGMAVGVVLAGVISGQIDMTMASAVSLTLGIALQNVPEGAIISLPLRSQGFSRKKALGFGILSGIVEPLSAVFTILLIEHLVGAFPYLLAFAAGAMIYVVVEELIPSSHNGKHSNLSTIGFAIGFVVMMVLDVALG